MADLTRHPSRRGGSEQMANGLGIGEIIATASTVIAVGAMVVATMRARYAKQAAKEAKRQADAALGEVPPLIFLDSITFANPQSLGGRAMLTFVNQNRLLDIEIETDPAILVSADTGELRDAIAAALQHSRKGEGAPLRIDLHEKHLVVQGSSIGVVGSRLEIPLTLTRIGNRNYTQETANIRAIVRYLLLDARHTEQRVEVFATVPFRF
jgi:hypothetical protein